MSTSEITGAEHDRQCLEAMRAQARNGRDPVSEVQVDHLVQIGYRRCLAAQERDREREFRLAAAAAMFIELTAGGILEELGPWRDLRDAVSAYGIRPDVASSASIAQPARTSDDDPRADVISLLERLRQQARDSEPPGT
jgi:hypothetical protein